MYPRGFGYIVTRVPGVCLHLPEAWIPHGPKLGSGHHVPKSSPTPPPLLTPPKHPYPSCYSFPILLLLFPSTSMGPLHSAPWMIMGLEEKESGLRPMLPGWPLPVPSPPSACLLLRPLRGKFPQLLPSASCLLSLQNILSPASLSSWFLSPSPTPQLPHLSSLLWKLSLSIFLLCYLCQEPNKTFHLSFLPKPLC